MKKLVKITDGKGSVLSVEFLSKDVAVKNIDGKSIMIYQLEPGEREKILNKD